MRRELLYWLLDRIGKSQRVINALDGLDTDSDLDVATRDPRVKIGFLNQKPACPSVEVWPMESQLDQFLLREDGPIDIWCHAREDVAVLRIRDAVGRELSDRLKGWPGFDPAIGRIQNIFWAGDGVLEYVDSFSGYRATGSVDVVFQHHESA